MTLAVCVLMLVLHSDKCKMQCILGSGKEMLLFLLQFQSICGLCSTVGWLCTQPSTQAFIHKQLLYNPQPRFSYINNTCTTPLQCTTLYPGFHIQTTPVQSLYFVLNLHLHTQTTPAVEGITGASQKYYNSCPQNSRKSTQPHTKIQTHTGCV